MKNLLSLFILSIILFSCEDTADNSHVMQANVENVFFKTETISATYFENGEYFILEGNSGGQIISLKIKYPPENVNLDLGLDTGNIGTYANNFGLVYTTDVEGGSGNVIINSIDTSSRYINGDFNFTAISQALDTITVSSGLFYKVNYRIDVED